MNVDDDEYSIQSTAIQTYEMHYVAAKRKLEYTLSDKAIAPKATDAKVADPKNIDPKVDDPVEQVSLFAK